MKRFAAFILMISLVVTTAPGIFAADSDAKTPPEGLEEKVAGWKTYNDDTVGWLHIPDTKINNVIVQSTGDRNQFYFRRNAKKEFSFTGCYFADFRCDFSGGKLSDNTVIYGHSFNDNPNGRKFDQLKKYLDDDFAAEHPYIYFSNGNQTYTFKVFAVFIADVSLPYNTPDADAETRAKILETAEKLSVREYSSQPSPTAKLLTLSTTTYTGPDGKSVSFPNDYRFVVMAKLVKTPS